MKLTYMDTLKITGRALVGGESAIRQRAHITVECRVISCVFRGDLVLLGDGNIENITNNRSGVYWAENL